MIHEGKPLPLVVYIAGPFRGPSAWDIELNIRRAEELAWMVWRCGAAAVCPHTNTRFYQGSLPDEVWLVGDLAILAGCDALLTTPDWERSSGARAEVEFARANQIPVFHTLDTLLEYIDQAKAEREALVKGFLKKERVTR